MLTWLLLLAALTPSGMPTEVKIGHEMWQVEVSYGPLAKNPKCGDLVALTHCDKRLIQIDVDRPLPEVQVTYLHELQHALTHCAGRTPYLTRCDKQPPLDTNLHQIIYDTSPKWRDLLRDNPDLVHWLLY